MQCEQVRQTLDMLVRQGAKPAQGEPVTDHLNSCDLCRQALADMQVKHQLAQLQAPELDQPTQQRLLRRAAAGRPRIAMPAVAMAAVLLLSVAITSLYTGKESPGPDAAVTQAWRTEIRLVVHSDVDVSDAELSITLAENLELDGFPDQQQLAWRTSLKKGKNLLVLPLRGIHGIGSNFELTSSTSAKQSRIVVSVDGHGKVRSDSIEPANTQSGNDLPYYPATSLLPIQEMSRDSGQEHRA